MVDSLRHTLNSRQLRRELRRARPGPMALIFAEDDVLLEQTLRHYQALGFKAIVLFCQPSVSVPFDIAGEIIRVDFDYRRSPPMHEIVSQLMPVLAGRWLFYCYSAEFLIYPFFEMRRIGEMLAFHGEERRSAMLTYIVDLYADDLGQFPDAVSMTNAYFDKAGYFAQARDGIDGPKERQLDFYGGLRRRFEEHIPEHKRRMDRISLFKADKKLTLREDYTFSNEEYNTYSCPWHHNLTAAVCSFRTAKALKRNAGSTFDISTFIWHNSVRFEWSSQQLLELGLIEPGQWF